MMRPLITLGAALTGVRAQGTYRGQPCADALSSMSAELNAVRQPAATNCTRCVAASSHTQAHPHHATRAGRCAGVLQPELQLRERLPDPVLVAVRAHVAALPRAVPRLPEHAARLARPRQGVPRREDRLGAD